MNKNLNFDKISFGENLKSLRIKQKLNQSELALRLNVSQNTISNWENGNREPDTFDDLLKIANYFSVPVGSLLTQETRYLENYLHTLKIPLYTLISCGSAMFVGDNVEEYITLPVSLLHQNKEYFAQYAKGDSMIDENIQDGDLLVFEKSATIQNGQIGCFCIDENMATCKKFYKDDASAIITLQPANKTYAPIIVTVETMMFHVVGKLALVINKR